MAMERNQALFNKRKEDFQELVEYVASEAIKEAIAQASPSVSAASSRASSTASSGATSVVSQAASRQSSAPSPTGWGEGGRRKTTRKSKSV